MSEDSHRSEREFLVTIMFAAVVSEAVPYRQILGSSKFQSIFAWGVRELEYPSLLVFLIAFFPVLEALVLLVALGAYLGATRGFSLRGFLRGLLVGLVALGFGFVGMVVWDMMFSFDLSPLFPHLSFYYVVWRLPLFFGLVVAVWIARPRYSTPAHPDPEEPPTTPDARDIDQLLDALLLLSNPQTPQRISDLRRQSKP